MKIFISWSGEKSREIASYLKEWLGQIIQSVDPWISIDIDKGKRWNEEISNNLEESRVGIFCITDENIQAPWIMFEAGAISKTRNSYVCTLLFNVRPTDLTGPLTSFQATIFKKEDFFQFLKTINDIVGNNGEKSIVPENLKSLYELLYPKLEEKVTEILSIDSSSKDKKEIRTDRDLLEETVQILRTLKKGKPDASLESEGKVLLEFYAEKYAKKVGQINYNEVGNNEHFDSFFRIIEDNPFLIKAFNGQQNLIEYIRRQYDELQF